MARPRRGARRVRHEVTGALLGVVTTPVGTGDDVAEAIILDPDDRPVIAGWTENGGTTDILLIRYDGGVPDPTFGTGGIVRTAVPGGAKALALMVHDDYGIAVTGHDAGDDIFVARYDLNGQPDPGFGSGGITITPVGGPAAANAIAPVGSSDILIAGWVRVSPDADILQARYRNNGNLRPSFGDSGIAVTSLGATDDVAEALAIDGNRAYIAGWSGAQVMLAKYTFDADLVPGFDGDGIVQRSIGTDARALSLTVEQDGSVLAAGWATMGGAKTFLVLHHLADGSPDSTIGTDGVVTTGIGSGTAAAEAVITLADESRMAVGWADNGSDDDFAAVRYLHSPRCGNGILEPEGGETCDHGASDSCRASCQLQPVGTSCSSDGDPCTEDLCDEAGLCIHPAAQAACGPQLSSSRQLDRFCPSTSVSIDSVLHVGQISAEEPRAFCLPASVDGVPVVVDPTLGETSHRLAAPRHRPRQNVSVYDRFGLSRLRMNGASRLLVPSRIEQGSPPLAPPPDGAANFFECYRVKRASGAPPFPDGVQATVADALTNHSYDVRRPKRLCVPGKRTARKSRRRPRTFSATTCGRPRVSRGTGVVPGPCTRRTRLMPDGSIRERRRNCAFQGWPCRATRCHRAWSSLVRMPTAPTSRSSSTLSASSVRARRSSSMRRTPTSIPSKPTASPAATGASHGSSRRMATS